MFCSTGIAASQTATNTNLELARWTTWLNVMMSRCPYVLQCTISVGLVVQCLKDSGESVERQREKEERERDAKEHCCPQEMGFDICGSTQLLWGQSREGSGAERLLGAVGRRV